MKKRKFGMALALVLAAGTILGACGNKDEKDTTDGAKDTDKKSEFSVAMVTDVGGVDDKSFNQSAWEGLKKFGSENGLKEGNGGYHYLQSKNDADYTTNLNQLARENYDLIFGIGFMMYDSMKEIAEQQTDKKFSIVDSVVDLPNVASITFKEHEGSFLVGVVAGLTTKTNKIGFVGGVEGELIQKFEVGFRAGVASVNPKAEVQVKYAGAFDKADLGQATAQSMYKSGIDIIYHAAGGTGNGIFTEAINLKKQDMDREIWVIGVDKDQSPEGKVDDKTNITLTSMFKAVDVAVADVAKKTQEGNFPGGKEIQYGLDVDGVGIAPTTDNLSDEVLEKVAEYKEKIVKGEIKVPSNLDELKSFK